MKNTSIYVTGLPLDTTISEVYDYFSKSGIIMTDMFNQQPRIHLYEHSNGSLKGDAMIVYLREESVKLACTLYDESQFRPGITIHVEPAQHQQHETYDPSIISSNNIKISNDLNSSNQFDSSPFPSSFLPSISKKMIDKKQWQKQMQIMCKKLAWDDPEEIEKYEKKLSKYQRIVVLSGLQNIIPDQDQDPKGRLDLKEEILLECKNFGTVTSIHIVDDYDLITVKYKHKEMARDCIEMMNGRWFGGHQITSLIYDGSFKIKETRSNQEEQEEADRLDKFGEWLEEEEEDENNMSNDE